jgi:peptidoglycan/xylan/chitin deacetylase (PgdA/CDA1 family)
VSKFGNYLNRFRHRYRRELSQNFARWSSTFEISRPIISFTFDDFPRNAATTGRKILGQFDVLATYYLSFGLAGSSAPTGQIFERAEVEALVAGGHELGCHTFDHCHAWDTDARTFAASLDRNKSELQKTFPGLAFQTMSYPISCPNPGVKRVAMKRFAACRGGDQTFNSKSIDRNDLKAFFLEKVRSDLNKVRSVIAQNEEANGWLIFATHDVSESPTPYGCTPRFFEEVVAAAANSRAVILPVHQALQRVLAGSAVPNT